MSALAKIYGKHVLSGKKSIDEVPERIREEVKEIAFVMVNAPFFIKCDDYVLENDTEQCPMV